MSHATINALVVNRNKREALQQQIDALEGERSELIVDAARASVPISEVTWAAGCDEGTAKHIIYDALRNEEPTR